MTKVVKFENIDVSGNGIITCEVSRETTGLLEIKLPYSFRISPDLLAFAFATLAGKDFSEIYIDLPLGPSCVESISERCEAKVYCSPGTDLRRRTGRSLALNFSGGFDSLAAHELLPGANLISLDFGGRFSRERNYFEKYDPLIFETNLTTLGLNRHSWQFMGIGSILLRDELDLKAYSFGSIMAGSLPRLLKGPLDQSNGGLGYSTDLGMILNNPVAGISEVAALSLVMASKPQELLEVLQSVALPTEDKFLRKYQMLHAVAALNNFPVSLPSPPVRTAHMTWGQNFATDLSSLFVAKQLGIETVASTYVGGIPDSAIKFLNESNLDFMMRFNPHAYAGVESEITSRWYAQLTQRDISPFEKKDWEEATRVLALLQSI